MKIALTTVGLVMSGSLFLGNLGGPVGIVASLAWGAFKCRGEL